MFEIKFPDTPKGQITTFYIFIFSALSETFAFKSQNSILAYIFAIMALGSWFFGVLVFAGWIPCKERVQNGKRKPPKQGKK